MPIIDANTLFGFWPKREVDISVEKLLQITANYKVDQVLSLSAKGIFYDFEEGNQETLKLSRIHPQIIPVATCDLRRYFGREKVVQRAVEQGFRIMRLFPDLQGWPIDYKPFYQLIQELAEHRFPLMIAVTGQGMITQLDKLLRDLPIAVILSGVSYWFYAEALAIMNENPRIYVEGSLFDTPDSWEIFTRQVGAERLIFGSFSPLHYLAPAINSLQKAEITAGEKQLIFYENIRTLLSLDS